MKYDFLKAQGEYKYKKKKTVFSFQSYFKSTMNGELWFVGKSLPVLINRQGLFVGWRQNEAFYLEKGNQRDYRTCQLDSCPAL